MVRLFPLLPFVSIPRVIAQCDHGGAPCWLTLHCRRMQEYHAILLEVYQVPSWVQRPRVPRPLQVIPFLSNGAVRALQSFRHTSPATQRYKRCCPAHKGGEDLVKPSCQSHWDQVIGSSCLDAEKGCKGEVLHPSPLPLGRSENGSVVESEYFLPLQSRVRPSLTRTACLRKYPHIHFLPSHCFGSIRMKPINS
jgi:putative component of membrane protein insertase Oxa1/YidC/SpoIIIJ protein YidD